MIKKLGLFGKLLGTEWDILIFQAFHMTCQLFFKGMNWDHLADDFGEEDFLKVIKMIPTDHAPGPDGFNGKFIKKCWAIIKADFLRLFADFFNNLIDLTSINSSYIALIPKKNNPESVDDFRPISLLNYSVKCITKLMFIRLQDVILKLVHENQYGFIKGRTIQDCLAWAFQFLHFLPPLQKGDCHSEA